MYRGGDQRLGRDVALKILKESFARDSDRIRRFEQEARAVAAPNHPNIVALCDIGAQDGHPYLVSELLHGQSLREVLQEGAIPAWSPDGKLVAVGIDGKKAGAIFVGVATGVRVIPPSAQFVFSASWLPDQSGLLVTAGRQIGSIPSPSESW